MRRIEALADALARMCGALDPDSEAYSARNPILLKAFAPKHEKNAQGHRVFKTFIAGYENALLDLKIKCSGQSRAKLTPDSQLVCLLTTYGHPPTSIRYITKFLRQALKDETIHDGVRLSYFLEDEVDARPGSNPSHHTDALGDVAGARSAAPADA